MGFHHVAITTRDLAATHAFYTDVMGFELVRADAAPTPEAAYGDGDGWARHCFYDTGNGQCLAVWDLHDPEHLPTEFDPSLSRAMGLPPWTNHLAFDAPTRDDLEAHKQRWISCGYAVVEGTGVTSLLKRTLARTMMTLSRRRGRLHVVASLDELLTELGPAAMATRIEVHAAVAGLIKR